MTFDELSKIQSAGGQIYEPLSPSKGGLDLKDSVSAINMAQSPTPQTQQQKAGKVANAGGASSTLQS